MPKKYTAKLAIFPTTKLLKNDTKTPGTDKKSAHSLRIFVTSLGIYQTHFLRNTLWLWNKAQEMTPKLLALTKVCLVLVNIRDVSWNLSKHGRELKVNNCHFGQEGTKIKPDLYVKQSLLATGIAGIPAPRCSVVAVAAATALPPPRSSSLDFPQLSVSTAPACKRRNKTGTLPVTGNSLSLSLLLV